MCIVFFIVILLASNLQKYPFLLCLASWILGSCVKCAASNISGPLLVQIDSMCNLGCIVQFSLEDGL